MGHFFDFEGPFFSFIEKAADIVILNIVFIICCLPVITIGASLTALSSVTQKIVRKEEGYIIKGFFVSFKRNFIQATLIWIIMLIFAGIFWIDIRILSKADSNGINAVFTGLLMLLGIIYIFELIYVFPVLAKFDNTVINTMRNALILSVSRLPWTLVLLLLLTVPPVIGYFYIWAAIPIYIFAGFSLTSCLSSAIFVKIFEPLITDG